MGFEAANRNELERALLAAHSEEDGLLLAQLYEQAADLSEAAGDAEAACFYLTHALVFALQEGADSVGSLRARLHAYGCEDL